LEFERKEVQKWSNGTVSFEVPLMRRYQKCEYHLGQNINQNNLRRKRIMKTIKVEEKELLNAVEDLKWAIGAINSYLIDHMNDPDDRAEREIQKIVKPVVTCISRLEALLGIWKD